ncbi:MAG: histidinol-phosphate transaminase [Bacteroidota bacterium]
MKDLDKLVRNNIRVMRPYSSARDEYEGDGEIFLDANENPFDTGLNRYPDPYQRKLKAKIAELKSVRTEQLFLGNGSDEAIDLILRIFCEPGKDEIITLDPTYGMYQVSAAIQDISVRKAPLSRRFELSANSVLRQVDSTTKVIFLCTPNNPSGNDLDHDEIRKIITAFSGIVVIDEAYTDFSNAPSFTLSLDQYSNVIVLQTFSKAWGMAALRLGMAFTSPQIIRYLNKVKAPYNLNLLAQREAMVRLNEVNEVRQMAEELKKARVQLVEQIATLPIVKEIFPSSANFLLVRFTDSKTVFNYLIKKEIIVRDRSKALYCENCLRITVGTSEENDKLLKALNSLNA